MKKIILLVLCFVLGAFALTGCSGSNEPFTQKDYTAGEGQVNEVWVDVRDRQIEVVLSEDAQIHIAYFENSKEYYDISVSDDKVLTMTAASNKGWTDYIGGKPSADVRKIVLRLPNEILTSLRISTSNETISLPSFTVQEEISLTANGGGISFERLHVGKAIRLHAKNGDIQGSILGSYDDFSIDCNIKKGESNLPSNKEGGDKTLSVTVNNGNADIDFQN